MSRLNKIIIVFTALAFLFRTVNHCYSQSNDTVNQAVQDVKKNTSVQEDISNSLGLLHSAKNLEKIDKLFQEGKIQDAENLLVPIKDWLNDATEMHFNLSKTFKDKQIPESKIEKAHALDFGNLRDQALYLQAKIYVAQGKNKEAIKLLVSITTSQVNSELGKDAYKLLQDLRFSDTP